MRHEKPTANAKGVESFGFVRCGALATPRRFVALVVVAVFAAGCHSGEEKQTAPGSAATTATVTPAGPPVFSAWAKYERNPKIDQAQFADNYIDLTLGHQVFQFPPQGIDRKSVV